VVAGSARGCPLTTPKRDIRPTSERVRGAIFDALESHDVDMTRVLDLYAGSGALGIEALSRGASWCDFVESDAACVAAIKENLRRTRLQDRAKVYRLRVERVLSRLTGPYTLVLADPPYSDRAALRAIDQVARSPLIAPQATLVLEHSSRDAPPEALGSLQLDWTRRYGDTQVSWYAPARAESTDAQNVAHDVADAPSQEQAQRRAPKEEGL
jgi:16S rRNA (guanine966-N2)-methyltransferase